MNLVTFLRERLLARGFILLLPFGASALEGCATIKTGDYALPMDASGHLAKSPTTTAGLVISGEEITDLSSPYFGFVAITMENRTEHYVHVARMNVTFGDAAIDPRVFIPWGQELESWQSGTIARNEIRYSNERAALLGVAVAGSVISATAHDRGGRGAGGLVTAGADLVLAARSNQAESEAIVVSQPFPDTHLLAVPFSVPPGLFARKWIVLHTNSPSLPCLQNMLLDYTTDTGKRDRVWLKFRSRGPKSEWQRSACYTEPPSTSRE